ncbi:MAG: universal stress protein, partial [Muribaculaceae bacterium]|nr:universal stress protein [Muribaculaceae bacterium]
VITGPLVDMALLMRNTRGTHRFYALHVRNDNSTASKTISANALRTARDTGAAADIVIDTLDRYDLNTVTGVLNVIQERDITEIIIGMHTRATVIDSFFGSKTEQLLRSTHKMVMIVRCFIPVNTITRVFVWVPAGAQYETGFSRWVRAVSRLTRQVGCRIIFCCRADVQPLIRGVIYTENFGIRCEFRTTEGWDDLVMLCKELIDDDLFVVIGARAQSVSYCAEMADLPAFLQRYFSRNNLMMIYPEQFGQAQVLTSFADPLSSDISAPASPVLNRIRSIFRTRFRR